LYAQQLHFCYSATDEENIVPRIWYSALVMVAWTAGLWAAESPPNFSGTWKMDPSRSESAHQAVPIGTVVLVMRQTPTSITIETQRTPAGTREVQTETLRYLLSGAETTIRDEGKSAVKTKATWDGTKLITETEGTVNGASVTTRYVHSLADNRREMKLDKTLTVQHGYQFEGAKSYGTGTDIFVKTTQ